MDNTNRVSHVQSVIIQQVALRNLWKTTAIWYQIYLDSENSCCWNISWLVVIIIDY
jgi:hypothetical protein